MKKYFILLTAASAVISLSAKSQDGNGTPKPKHKSTKEIIIREDGDKDKGKTTIVIDEEGKVTVNGKPSADWDGGKVNIVRDFDFDAPKIMLDRDLAGQQTIKFKMLQDGLAFEKVRLGVYTSEDERGAKVTRVTDSSAAFKAGLKEGDVITKVDNTPISNPDALSKVIREHKPGDAVAIHYLRGDKEEQARVTLEKPADVFKTFAFDAMPRMNFRYFGRPRLGANIQDTEDTTGVKVLRVNPESPAEKAGLKKDDVITSIDGKPVHSVDQAMDILGDDGDKFNYPMTVNRGGTTVTLEVKIPRDLKTGTL